MAFAGVAVLIGKQIVKCVDFDELADILKIEFGINWGGVVLYIGKIIVMVLIWDENRRKKGKDEKEEESQ